MKIVISCGGTGGHFFPGLALAREAGKENARLLLSGIHAENQKAIAEKYEIPAVALPPMPVWKRHFFRFLGGLVKGYATARKTMKSDRPDAVIGMGSFASLPILLAAKNLHIPVFLHDGNARIGKANRILSRCAKMLGIAFPAVNHCSCPVYECGMPVRQELIVQAEMTRLDALAKIKELFGTDFSADAPILLVFGGSQGAAAINAALPVALQKYGRSDIQIIHLTGVGKLDAAREAYQDLPNCRLLLETTSEMGALLAAADLVVSRSGGSTVAELALFGKPAVLIPYPYAAEGHQTDNARYYEKGGAASVLLQSDLSADVLLALLKCYLDDESKRKSASGCAKALGRPRAAADFLTAVAREIK